jgi:hypothetical protein
MKKIFALVSLLSLAALAASCTAPTENANLTTTGNANVAATRPSPTAPTEALATAKEREAWDLIKKKDYDTFASMLASDQILVAPDAVYDKPGTLNGLKSFELIEVTFSDWKYLPIDAAAFAITYTAYSKARMDGKDMPAESWRHSSAWVNRDGKWLSVYHQETPVKKGPPPPPPAAASKAPATPVTIVTGPDPVANENAIWQALKNRDYNSFGSALAPESVEVEPDGVYDKAGTMKLVGQFDFSKAVLSDFKSVKFDADAALVSYLVKMPGGPPDGERHTTIWANRAGKWLAVFHHGTPVMKAPPTPPAKAAASPAAKAPTK